MPLTVEPPNDEEGSRHVLDGDTEKRIPRLKYSMSKSISVSEESFQRGLKQRASIKWSKELGGSCSTAFGPRLRLWIGPKFLTACSLQFGYLLTRDSRK